ncbi:endonuclease domain-containing protein [Streptomyces globisporus]|uniref:endonuclease domain-containing protein n=1 Tax=Streptomyces globisporus TaxID=1908 RepID=UPI0036760987
MVVLGGTSLRMTSPTGSMRRLRFDGPLPVVDSRRRVPYKRPESPPGKHWCNKCLRYKPVEDCWKHKKGVNGLCGACKDCMKAANKANRSAMRHRAKTVYGLTLEEYDALKQGVDACPICGDASTEFHLDHNEGTGRIRQFICGKCNRGLGMFKHEPKFLREAALYLEKHSE